MQRIALTNPTGKENGYYSKAHRAHQIYCDVNYRCEKTVTFGGRNGVHSDQVHQNNNGQNEYCKNVRAPIKATFDSRLRNNDSYFRKWLRGTAQSPELSSKIFLYFIGARVVYSGSDFLLTIKDCQFWNLLYVLETLDSSSSSRLPNCYPIYSKYTRMFILRKTRKCCKLNVWVGNWCL